MNVKYVLVSDFEKVCRICMKFDKTFLSINSFQIIDMIIACASVQIWENDDLPNQICDACFLQLQNTINFKQLCENSDVAFRQIIEQSKNKIWNTQNELDNVKEDDADSLNYSVYIKEENDDENVINLSKDGTKKSKPDSIAEKSEITTIQYKFEEESNGFEDVKDENDADYVGENEKPDSGEPLHEYSYKYNCETCTKSFKKVDTLGWHMKNLHNAEGIQCGSCFQIFYHSLHLSAHEKSHNQCSICNSSFTTRRKLNQHKLTHKNTLTCDSCDEKFRKQRDLQKHVRKMHPKMKLPRNRSQYKKQDASCELCGKIVRRCNLSKHMLSHRERNNLNCRYCEKAFLSPEALKDHMEVAHKKCVCDHCGLRLRPNQLKTHLLTHTKERPYACDRCDKTYSQKCRLKQHISRTHLNERKSVCTICSQAFFDEKCLSTHMLSHRERNNLNCRYCEKVFLSPEALKDHMEVDHKKCVCDHCGLRLHSNKLKRHLRTHTKERPFACDRCDKSYTDNYQLKTHISRIHLKERNFVCTFCSQAFFDKKILLNHVRRHTGEKPFKCQICEKRFIQKVALNVHMKTHINAM